MSELPLYCLLTSSQPLFIRITGEDVDSIVAIAVVVVRAEDVEHDEVR